MCSPTSGRVRWSSPGASADGLAGVETPDDFNASVWAEWDAKSPRAQVDDALVADAAFAAQVAAVPQADRDRFTTAFGPMTIGFDQAVGMRLSEHLLHEWDVRVTLDPSAALAPDGAAHVIGNLGPIVAFAGKPTGGSDTVVIATTDPEGQWAVTTTPDGVSFDRIDTWDQVHVTMPTEALVRLIYGRLSPGAHAGRRSRLTPRRSTGSGRRSPASDQGPWRRATAMTESGTSFYSAARRLDRGVHTMAADRYTIISADTHAGGSHEQYREYLDPRVPRRLRRLARPVQEPVEGPARHRPAHPQLGRRPP